MGLVKKANIMTYDNNDGPNYSMLSGKPLGAYTCMKTTESWEGNTYIYFYCLTGCDTNPNCDVNYLFSCYDGQDSHCCGLSGTCGNCMYDGTYPCPEFCDGAPPHKTWSIECYNVSGCNGDGSCGSPV